MPNKKQGVFHMDTFGNGVGDEYPDTSSSADTSQGNAPDNQGMVVDAQGGIPELDAILDELQTIPAPEPVTPSHHETPVFSKYARTTPAGHPHVGKKIRVVVDGREVDAYENLGPEIPMPHIPPQKKAGRPPVLSSEQVQGIIRDMRSLRSIAAEYGVSVPTIRRVKRRGAFKDEAYIPADEYVREEVTSESNEAYHDTMPPLHGEDYDADEVAVGRPYKGRETPLTDREKLNIIMVPGSIRDVAEKYGVSTATVSRLRRMTRTHMPLHDTGPKTGQPMTLLEAVLADPRPASIVAAHYGLTPPMINHLREDVTSQGNPDASKDGDET